MMRCSIFKSDSIRIEAVKTGNQIQYGFLMQRYKQMSDYDWNYFSELAHTYCFVIWETGTFSVQHFEAF